jgi:hypothetical protein
MPSGRKRALAIGEAADGQLQQRDTSNAGVEIFIALVRLLARAAAGDWIYEPHRCRTTEKIGERYLGSDIPNRRIRGQARAQ